MSNLKTIFKGLNELLEINVWILSGNEKNTQECLSLIFAGREIQKNYITKIVFESNNDTFFLGKYSIWSLYFLIKKPQYKHFLIFIEGYKFYNIFLKNKKYFFIPLWLTSTVTIPLVARNNSTKNDYRAIIQNELSYKIADSIEEFHHFYYSMYLPTVENRHSNTRIIMEYKMMLDEINNHEGKLLLVKKENKYIAGVVIVTREEIPRIWSNGILEGDTAYWKTGAIAATYWFSSQYLFQKGCTKMNMGLNRSFLNDGILQYKKKWGADFLNQSKRGFILKINMYSKGTEGFLKNNPFAYSDKNNFYGAIFIDKKDIENEFIKNLKPEYFLKSFNCYHIFHLKKNDSTIKKIE